MACPTVTTSSTAWYQMPDGTCVEVEVIRSSNCETSIFVLGTNTRIEPFDPTRLSTVNPCAADGPPAPVEIDSSCEDPVFVEICNPVDQPIEVISETSQLGCVTDPATGELTGKVYFVPSFDADGNMTSNRMVMVGTDGTVTDPYTGSWEACAESGVDVELNYLCVIDNATGNNLQSIVEEITYDSAGVRISSRLVDRATGGPVSIPGGASIGVCPGECLPEPFSTECFEILEEQVQYDNAGGTDPQLCGAPASGPADGGGNIPFIPCPGNYLITSWIINGAEVITGGPVSFRGQVCGSTADGQIGLHEDWARALNLIDGAAGWTNEYSTECANYVRVLNPDPNREYGAMVITDATDSSRVWTITNGVRRTIAEERFTRVYQRECDGSISTIWLNSTGEVIPQPEGNLQPCGMIEEEACVTCDTMTLCDTYIGAGESIFTTTPVPFAELPVITPTYTGQEPMDPAQEALLWSGDTAVIPAPVNPTQNQIHVTSGAVLSTTEPLVGPVEISVQMDWRRTGPNRGQLNTGGLFLMNGDTRIAYEFYPGYTPVDATGQLIVTATVPAEDIVAGNIVIVSLSEIHHMGNSGGWELSRLLVLEGGVEETQKFLRTICRSCDGRVVSVQDTAFDGITEYEVQGEVSACGEDRETQPEQEPCVSCQSMILCDMVTNPNESEGVPWNVVEVVPDETDPDHVLHYHLSPTDNPSVVGIVTLTTSTTLNGNGCSFPGVDYAISNPSTRTMTLDAVAQQMDALQVNLIDFDTFEPTRINAATPLPRLGGTAYWDGPPDHATTIRPTENDGTGILYWDNPPAEIIYTVGNTGGGNSCSNLDFRALTLSLMPRPFMRTICRDCNGEIVSTLDTEMDGVTPYTPVGDVTNCASGETDSTPEPEPPVEQEIFMDVVRIQDAMFDPGFVYDNVQSVTLTVLSGEVVVSANTQQPAIPAGVSLTWSVQKDQDGFLIPPQFDATAGGDFIVNVTYLGV